MLDFSVIRVTFRMGAQNCPSRFYYLSYSVESPPNYPSIVTIPRSSPAYISRNLIIHCQKTHRKRLLKCGSTNFQSKNQFKSQKPIP